MEISSNIRRVADFLQRQHIRPERIHKTGIILREDFAQSQSCIEQEIFLLCLRHMARFFRIIIIAEDIVRHCLDIEARTLIRNRNPLSQRHKVMRIHIVLDQLCAALRASQRKQWLIFIIGEYTIEILHNHGKARIIMAFLLRQHQMQSLGWLDRHLALNRTNSAHNCRSFANVYKIVYLCPYSMYFYYNVINIIKTL